MSEMTDKEARTLVYGAIQGCLLAIGLAALTVFLIKLAWSLA